MARALVTAGLKCYGGDADRCSAKTLLVDAAIGAGSSMLGAGVGGGLAAGGRAIFQGSSVLKTFGAGTVRGTFREAPKQLARTVGFVKGSISNFRTDAAVMGTKAVLKETAGWALKAGNTFDNYVGTFTGAIAPTTRDDWTGIRESGIAFNPVTAPIQAAGAFLGGMVS